MQGVVDNDANEGGTRRLTGVETVGLVETETETVNQFAVTVYVAIDTRLMGVCLNLAPVTGKRWQIEDLIMC